MSLIGELGRLIRSYIRTTPYVATSIRPGRRARPNLRMTGNAATVPSARAIAALARDAVRNNPYASRIVDVWVGHLVGPGIQTVWPATHSEAWRVWAANVECDVQRQLTWHGIQSLVMRTVVESGGALVRFTQRQPSPLNPVGLELQVMEVDQLDPLRSQIMPGSRTIGGVQLDDVGRPVGYWLIDDPDLAVGAPTNATLYPANEIAHIYRRRRPMQVSDVSWLAPALEQLGNLAAYEDALLRKAEVEANLALIINDDTEDALTGPGGGLLKDAHGNAFEELEPGMIAYRRGGDAGVSTVNPTTGGSHVDFARRTLASIAVGVGLTYDQVTGDLTQANYSSLRAGKIEFSRILDQLQYGMVIPMLIDRVAQEFHMAGAIVGLWGQEKPDPTHIAPPLEMIDPVKDTEATIMQVRAGLISMEEAVGRLGYNWPELAAKIAASNAMIDRMKLVLDSDPRRSNQAGAAQNPAQNAAIELRERGSPNAQA